MALKSIKASSWKNKSEIPFSWYLQLSKLNEAKVWHDFLKPRRPRVKCFLFSQEYRMPTLLENKKQSDGTVLQFWTGLRSWGNVVSNALDRLVIGPGSPSRSTHFTLRTHLSPVSFRQQRDCCYPCNLMFISLISLTFSHQCVVENSSLDWPHLN